MRTVSKLLYFSTILRGVLSFGSDYYYCIILSKGVEKNEQVWADMRNVIESNELMKFSGRVASS